MGKEYIAKSFMSGNSVAIRLPAALGIEPDREWTVSEVDGELHIRAKVPAPKRIDLSGIYGSCPGLKPLDPADRTIDPTELDWEGKRLGNA
ncbi:hypothetical protein ACQKOE_00610 [Novosphingobium sp. NPDC080210]|uniref:hypothetical protein n=1 Tax=unclassified Novosphingobium TaxID=2644732 RepID=UPI0035B4F3E8